MYRLLLWLFPRDIRREFGADMEELFNHHRRRARGVDVCRLWISAIADALRHGLGARIERLIMDIFTHDIRYAIRMLLKQPAITATMLLTLALGIGANTAVFSVIHAVLLRALPYPEPGQLVMVFEKRPARRRDGQLCLPGGLSRLDAAESVVLGDGRVFRGHGRSDRRGRSRATAGRRRDVDVLRRARRAGAAWPYFRRRRRRGRPSPRGRARPRAVAAAIRRRSRRHRALGHVQRYSAGDHRRAARGLRAAGQTG